MRKNHIFTSIFTVLLLFVGTALSAQMSDEQVIQELRRLENAGVSQQQMQVELMQRGVTPVQLQRIRNQQANRQNAIDIGADTEVNEHTLREHFEVPPAFDELPIIAPEDRIFGHDFFSAITFTPDMNMPTPANYILGAGDELIIDVWGHTAEHFRHTIAPDGHITIRDVGRIQLSGLTFEQAQARIKNQLATIYSDLASTHPQTFMAMSLGNVRTIQVHVMGEVMRPNTYTLSSLASVFHALHVSGGPNRIGSLRNIHVFRGGNKVATIDLYEYLMNADSSSDITLRDGDLVRVDPHSVLTQIIGEVRRPMWYEMRENETLDDLIRFAGGFTGNAFRGNVALLRRGDVEMEAFTLSGHEFASFHLQDGDQVSVESILDRFANMIEITGAVYRPGQYAIGNEIRTVKDLINIAQGTTGDAYLYRVLLHRQQDDLREIMYSFSLLDLLNGRRPDIILQRNDRLHVPSIFSIEDNITVSISGEVRAPGSFPFALNMHIEDLLLRAGGLTDAASTAQIDVFRRMRDPASVSVPVYTSETFSLSLRDGHVIESDVDFVLQPFDEVFVRRSPAYQAQQIVTVRGEVLHEGPYAKIRRDERLSSLIERAGGLTDAAFVQGARLSRELTEAERRRARDAADMAARVAGDTTFVDGLDFSRDYVSIDLVRALQNPGGNADAVLREGDILYIPVFNSTVRISGGVLHPNIVTYDSRMNLNAYVRQAGGFTRLAMRNRAYVVHMNGQVSTGRWATVTPGSEIVIPERPEREGVSMQNMLGMSTSLATLALVIMNILR